MQRSAFHIGSQWVTNSSQFAGISYKTQALYLTVFCTRYVDLLLGSWVSLYNAIMKIFFIGSSAYILYLMKFKYRSVPSTIVCLLLRSSTTAQANTRRIARHVPARLPASACRPDVHHLHLRIYAERNPLVVLHLAGISCDLAAAVHAAAYGRGGDDHDPLLGGFGTLSRIVYS